MVIPYNHLERVILEVVENSLKASKKNKEVYRKIVLEQKDSSLNLEKTNHSLKKYLERLIKYFDLDTNCYIVALIYMDRFFSKVAPTEFNIHKVIFISIVMSTKFLDDEIYTDQMMAEIGGVTVDSLCEMEMEFLNEVNFKLNVDDQIFKHFEKIVTQRNKNHH